MSKIKIMHIISDTNIGGAGNLLLAYLSAHDREAFEQCVALPSGSMLKAPLEGLGIPIYETAALRDKSFDLKAIRELRRVIRRAEPDIVHTHGAMSGRIAGRQCGKQVIFTRHSAFPPNPRLTRGLGRLLFKTINERYAHRIIAVSGVCADALYACGISRDRVSVIPNGVPPLPRKTAEECEATRAHLGIGPAEFVATILARIEPYKGQRCVVEAAKALSRRGAELKIIVAGTGADEAFVRNRAKALGVESMVLFTGFISDVSAILSISDVQINASTVEATSLSLLEGMSMGLPAIASNASGNPDVIEDGVNGLLFEAENPENLAECMERLMRSPGLMDTLRDGALRVYRERYEIGRVARSVEKVYYSMLEESEHGK